jgi:Transcriptional regulators
MRKKIVMQDIADRLNISKNSVSQALSGKDGVSEETRRRVIQAAEEMGYTYKKKKTQSRQKQETRTIGLIASERTFSLKTFFGELYLSIEREAQRHGTRLLIQSITSDDCEQLTMPGFIQDKSVDGVLILSNISTPYINRVISEGIPVVLIDHHHPAIEADAILTNNRFGAYNAVRHLLDCQHRNIAIIGNISLSPSYQERWEGYLLAMRDHGIEPQRELMFLDIMEEEQAVEKVLSNLKSMPEAWFCLNDGFSFIVCNLLKKLGYRVPGDVSICGFDNNIFSQVSDPKITTMAIDLNLFAHKAFTQLMWRIDHPREAFFETLLPTKLIKRESTAPASRHPQVD